MRNRTFYEELYHAGQSDESAERWKGGKVSKSDSRSGWGTHAIVLSATVMTLDEYLAWRYQVEREAKEFAWEMVLMDTRARHSGSEGGYNASDRAIAQSAKDIVSRNDPSNSEEYQKHYTREYFDARKTFVNKFPVAADVLGLGLAHFGKAPWPPEPKPDWLIAEEVMRGYK